MTKDSAHRLPMHAPLQQTVFFNKIMFDQNDIHTDSTWLGLCINYWKIIQIDSPTLYRLKGLAETGEYRRVRLALRMRNYNWLFDSRPLSLLQLIRLYCRPITRLPTVEPTVEQWKGLNGIKILVQIINILRKGALWASCFHSLPLFSMSRLVTFAWLNCRSLVHTSDRK